MGVETVPGGDDRGEDIVGEEVAGDGVRDVAGIGAGVEVVALAEAEPPGVGLEEDGDVGRLGPLAVADLGLPAPALVRLGGGKLTAMS